MKNPELIENRNGFITPKNIMGEESEPRISQYCHTVQSLVGKHKIVFNSFTGSLLELEPEEYDLVVPVLDGHATSTGLEKLDKRLCEAGVIVPNDLDELAIIRERRELRHIEKGFLGLTIAPTLQCNFRCDYCFEAHPNERMNAETEAALYEFIEKKSKAAQGISVTWYGGEPLLALNTIVRIQKFINEFGKKQGLTINREMITNGFLLSPKAVAALAELGEWSQIQVTLDGEAETHDKRRILVTGKGTWKKIVSNCKNALDHGLPLVIRMNIDARTPLKFKNVIEQLMEESIIPRAGVYLGHVASGTPENEHIKDLSLQRQQFANAKLSLSAHLLKQGLSSGISIPQAHCTLCTADSENGWVIAPTGLIYKCWEEMAMGPNSAVGHLTEKQSIQQMLNGEKWAEYDPLKKTGCSTCATLPVCMGGCPLHARQIKGDIGDCSEFRYKPKEIIQIAHAELAIGKHLAKDSKVACTEGHRATQ